ncbi:spindle assembly checkpoint component Mad1 [Schizothecium vesticola]|uniref:Spindle assembly checkpoint component MAD1 n=1 Tax=Schizothecium vesticola TaxID=314040 RepID=A0AA40K5C1_9PEZI|nr:spindle assembly checkpoint component Mad1 [Schizothecium vesticola]
MRSNTPKGDPPGFARPTSASRVSSFRASVGTGLPRPNSSLRESQFRASTQPSYNLFTGETSTNSTGSMARSTSRPGSRQGPAGPSPPRGRAGTVGTNFSRESSKENRAPADAEEYETQRRRIEELKAEVGTLKYQISSYEQEKELSRLQVENELRDTKRRAEDDFKSKQAAEAEKAKAFRQVEALQGELESLRADKETQKRELEGRAREAQEEARLLQEQLEDLNAAKDDAARMAEREITDLKTRLTASQRSAAELEEESRTREDAFEKVHALLAERDQTIGNLEADVLRLKAHTGDAETIAVIKRELSDQVTHMRALEAKNREQFAELKHLRQVHKAVEIVEEEKRSLQRRLEVAETVETKLAEERRQRMRLEDERRAWTSYLQSESSAGDSVEFESPEQLARALVEERLNSASLLEKLGALEPEITDRENIIKALEADKTTLSNQIEKLRSTGGSTVGNDKARARLERQRALAVKEAEYLRAQLKTFEMEDMTIDPESVDQETAKRVRDLEDLLEQHKQEITALQAELAFTESAAPPSLLPTAGTKRPHDDDDNSSQLGQLSRKNRLLQSELATLQTAHQLLEKEHSVATSQLAAARTQLQTRVLSLRSNPTSDFEAIKTATLSALRLENAELLAHIQRQPTLFATVPASQLAAAQRAVAEARAETASSQKSARRLKEVWASKSAEFKEAVFSTLGWTVSFIPGGKMRVESVYCPSLTDEHENSIVFDGEKGTMKVGGGPRSAFANRIGDSIKFWVRERGCVPGFLAALTLEFYEEQNSRAGGG